MVSDEAFTPEANRKVNDLNTLEPVPPMANMNNFPITSMFNVYNIGECLQLELPHLIRKEITTKNIVDTMKFAKPKPQQSEE